MMVRAVPVGELASHTRLFAGSSAGLAVAAAAEGNTEAQLWVADGAGSTPAALLWDRGNNVLYLAGEIAGPAVGALAALLAGPIHWAATAAGLARFKVRAVTPAWESHLEALFAGMALAAQADLVHEFQRDGPLPAADPSVAGLCLEVIDSVFLARADVANLAWVRDEVRWMWPSEARFAARGFGVAALADDRLIGWCTAEYVGRDRCGIGIATAAGYAGRGVATAIAVQFVAAALARGLRPSWECERDNTASRRVAEKVGFAPPVNVRSWLGTFSS